MKKIRLEVIIIHVYNLKILKWEIILVPEMTTDPTEAAKTTNDPLGDCNYENTCF